MSDPNVTSSQSNLPPEEGKKNTPLDANANNSFEDFQIEEYKNISNAHFEANKQIEAFFRYFLLIASAPAIIIIWFGKDETILSKLLDGKHFHLTLFASFFLIFISIIGFFACLYLISFRLDSILYARTVNGIRKYFYQKYQCANESHYRVLPKQTNQPKFRQRHTFSIIVWCFAIINSSFLALGTKLLSTIGLEFFSDYLHLPFVIFVNYNLYWTFACFVAFFLIHILYYNFITSYRNYSYMKTLTIGVDIDGVLNKHEITFCQFLKINTGIDLKPDEITRIPVHTIPGIKVSKGLERKHEFLVFNDIAYWEKQEAFQDKTGATIKELRNHFGYTINIFSYRAWPDTTYHPEESQKEMLKLWWKYSYKVPYPPDWLLEREWFYNFFNRKLKFKTIKKISKKWLKDNNIKYDDILIETSGIDVESAKFNIFRIPLSNYKNRFYFTRRDSYRYFVEDDLKNAIKLSANCEYVFLINHDYNPYPMNMKVPTNIIRVNNWSEIKEHIRELG